MTFRAFLPGMPAMAALGTPLDGVEVFPATTIPVKAPAPCTPAAYGGKWLMEETP